MHIPFRRCLPAVFCCILLSGCDSSTTAPEPAPDLTGIWVGTLTHSAEGTAPLWQVRLDLTEFDGNADGYLVGDLRTSYQNFYLRVGVTGNVDIANVQLVDGQLRDSTQPRPGRHWCRDRTFELEYRRVQGRDRLVGQWTTPTGGCVGGELTLDRQ